MKKVGALYLQGHIDETDEEAEGDLVLVCRHLFVPVARDSTVPGLTRTPVAGKYKCYIFRELPLARLLGRIVG